MTTSQDLIASYRSCKTLPHIVTRLSQLINDNTATGKGGRE